MTPASSLSRRDALLMMAGGALAATVPTAAVAARPARPLFDFAIAGGHYHSLPIARGLLTPGVRLRLRREPENPHDPNAVAVMLGDMRLGYVPRRANLPVAALLDGGAEIEAEVISHLDLKGDRDDLRDVAWTTAADGDPVLRLSVRET